MTLTCFTVGTPALTRDQRWLLPALGLCLGLLTGCETLNSVTEPTPPPAVETPAAPPETAVEPTPDEPTAADVATPPTIEPAAPPPVAVEERIAPPEVKKPVCPKPKPCPVCPAAKLQDKIVLGEIEEVTVSPPGYKYQARIDTGAEGTSVHATDIVRFERDGDRWVRFSITHPVTGEIQVLEREVVRRVRVKQVELEGFERRLVVMLNLTLGTLSQQTEVSLVDRSDMEFPILVGRNFLQNQAIVDVSQQMIAK